VIVDGKKRAISEAAFAANRYLSANVLTIDSGEAYADGSAITGVESALLTPGWLGTATPTSSALTVSGVSIAGATLPAGASNVSVLSVRLTAGSAAATVTSLTFKRLGIGNYDDWTGMYLYEGDTRLTPSARSINADSSEVEFPAITVSIPANSSKVITLRGDVTATANLAGSEQHSFQLKAVETTATVSGLPISGSTFVMSTVSVGGVTVAAGATPSNPNVGSKAVEVATLKLTAGDNDVEFNQIVLTKSGSIAASGVTNIKLYQESTLLASAASIASNDTVTLTLSSPYTILNGRSKSFSLKADLAGKVGETLTLKVDETNHVFVIDKEYGYGAEVTGSNITLGAITLQGGAVTLSDNGPFVDYIQKSGNDVVLTKFAMTADRDIEVKKLEVEVCVPTGVITAGSTTFSDLRIKDTDTGATVMSKALSGVIPVLCTDDTAEYVLTDSFMLKAGTTRNLAITVDTGSSDSIADTSIQANIQMNDASVYYDATHANIKDYSTGDYVLLTDVVPNSITGDAQTVQASALTATVASTPVTGLTVVKGATGVDGVGVILEAAEASAISVKQLGVRVYVNSAATFLAANEDTSPNGEITKVMLYDGATKLAEKTLSNNAATHDYGSATFDNLSVSVPAGQSKKLVVKFDVSSESAAKYVAVGIEADSISAYDSESDTVTATGDVNLADGTTAPGVYVIVSTTGSLSVAADAATPDSDIVIAGTTDVITSKIKFTATNEQLMLRN
jgi:predicted amino acid-binding ACT domain protein/alpha-D-ribose 1-methylphosphonate 5-triphosphate synthase subunit PhnG